MTRRDIVHEIAQDLKVTEQYVREIVDLYEKKISDALYRGEKVKLSNFARFETYTRKGSARYNIACKDKVYVPTKYCVRIKAIGDLKDSIENQKVSKFDLNEKDKKLKRW